LIKLF